MMQFLAQSNWAERTGWALVHSLWQFVLAALAVVVLQLALRRCSAAVRYRALLAAMLVMVVMPVATWFSPWCVNAPAAAAKSGRIDKPESVSPQSAAGFAGDASPNDVQQPSDSLPSTGGASGTPARPLAAHQRSRPVPLSATALWSTARNRVQSWLPEIVLIWFVGVLLFACRPLLSWHTMRRLRRVGVSPVGDAVQSLLVRTARRLGLRRAVEVVQSTLVKTPVVVGCFRPAILLPVCVVTGLPEAQLELILAHELAHVLRHDYLINLFQTLVETIFFYHPAVWWLSRQIRNERENCCDDAAMAAVGSRADYGRALLAIEELRASSPALTLAARGGSLLARIRRIAGCEPAPRIAGGVGVLCVLLASIVLLLGTTLISNERRAHADQIDISHDALPGDALLRLGTVRLRHRSAPACIAFSPDGRTIASAGYNQDMGVNLWAADTGKLIRRLTDPELKHGWTESVAFSPDGTKLLAGRADGVALLSDVKTGRILCKTKTTKSAMGAVAFAPDGSRFAGGGFDGKVRIWRVADGAEVKVFDTGRRLPKDSDYPGGWGLSALAFSPDGKLLAVAAGGPGAAAIQVWDADTGRSVANIDKAHGEAVWALVFTDDGRHLLSGGNGRVPRSEFGKPFRAKIVHVPEIRVWDPTTGKLIRELRTQEPEAGFGRIALSKNGKMLASSADEAIRLWDFASGNVIGTIPIPGWYGSQGFAISPDGKTVAAAIKDTVCLWDAATGKPILQDFPAHASGVGFVAYSPDGATIYTGGYDGRVMAWDAQSGKRIYHRALGRNPTISAMTLSRDGRLLAAGGHIDWHSFGARDIVRLWHAETGEPVRDFDGSDKHYRDIHRIAFSPDGKLLAVAAEMRRTNSDDIDVWEIESGKKVCEIRLERGNFHTQALEFSADSSTLFDVQSAELRAWDVKTGTLLRTCLFHTADQPGNDRLHISYAVFSHDRKWLIASRGASIAVIDAATGRPVSSLQLPGTDKGRYLGLSRDGRRLAAAEVLYAPDWGEGDVAICDLDPNTGAIRLLKWIAKAARTIESCDGRAVAFAFSPDNKRLATGMDGCTALVWDVTAAAAEQPEPADAQPKTNALSPYMKYLVEYSVKDILSRICEERVLDESRAKRLLQERAISPTYASVQGSRHSASFGEPAWHDNNLLLQANYAGHKHVADMLAAIRKNGTAEIVIEVRFISLNAEEYARVLSDATSAPKEAPDVPWPLKTTESEASERPLASYDGTRMARTRFIVEKNSPLRFRVMGKAQGEELMNRCQENPKTNVLQAPKIAVFSGQTAIVSDTSQSPFVVGLMEVEPGQLQPQIRVLSEGTTLQLRPIAGRNESIHLDFAATFSKIQKVETAVVGTSQTDEKRLSTIQIPETATLRMEGGAELMPGQWLLLGSLHAEKEAGEPEAAQVSWIERLFGRGKRFQRSETQELVLMLRAEKVQAAVRP